MPIDQSVIYICIINYLSYICIFMRVEINLAHDIASKS